jgi:AcrR family transcriptional regulator
VRRRLDNGRREELLDGVTTITAARGFSEVGIAEMAQELHCSQSSLYKIAPSKDRLIVLAIRRWGDRASEAAEVRAQRGGSASERARAFFRAEMGSMHSLSERFYADIGRYEWARLAWCSSVMEPFLKRFLELVQLAVDAGEIRPVNTRLLAEVLKQVLLVLRNKRVLLAAGLTVEEATLEADSFLWDGVLSRDKHRAGNGRRGARP